MVEVVNTAISSPIQESVGMVQELFTFVHTALPWLVFGLLLVGLGVLAWYLFKKLDEERKERDEPGYALYLSTMHTCRMQARKEYINVKWKPSSLWLIFVPFGVFFIPFMKSEHSVKLISMTNELIGYYRGEFTGQDNTKTFLLYKDKSFGFIEDTFLMKIPLSFRIDTEKVNEKTKKKTKVTTYIDMKQYIKQLPNKDIKLDNCIGMERVGQYYFVPNYVTESGGVLDYRKLMEGAIVDNTWQLHSQRLLNVAAKQMEKAIVLNPHLKYDQSAPEKTKEEKNLENAS